MNAVAAIPIALTIALYCSNDLFAASPCPRREARTIIAALADSLQWREDEIDRLIDEGFELDVFTHRPELAQALDDLKLFSSALPTLVANTSSQLTSILPWRLPGGEADPLLRDEQRYLRLPVSIHPMLIHQGLAESGFKGEEASRLEVILAGGLQHVATLKQVRFKEIPAIRRTMKSYRDAIASLEIPIRHRLEIWLGALQVAPSLDPTENAALYLTRVFTQFEKTLDPNQRMTSNEYYFKAGQALAGDVLMHYPTDVINQNFLCFAAGRVLVKAWGLPETWMFTTEEATAAILAAHTSAMKVFKNKLQTQLARYRVPVRPRIVSGDPTPRTTKPGTREERTRNYKPRIATELLDETPDEQSGIEDASSSGDFVQQRTCLKTDSHGVISIDWTKLPHIRITRSARDGFARMLSEVPNTAARVERFLLRVDEAGSHRSFNSEDTALFHPQPRHGRETAFFVVAALWRAEFSNDGEILSVAHPAE